MDLQYGGSITETNPNQITKTIKMKTIIATIMLVMLILPVFSSDENN